MKLFKVSKGEGESFKIGITVTVGEGNEAKFVVDYKGNEVLKGKYEVDGEKVKIEADFSGLSE